MKPFKVEIQRAITRLNNVREHVQPSNKADAVIVERLNRQLTFLNKHSGFNGFHQCHVGMFPTTENICHSLVKGISQSKARGNGRVASILDSTRSIGHGFRSGAASLIKFLGIPEGFISFEVDPRSKIALPVSAAVIPSRQIFETLDAKLMLRRARMVELLENEQRPNKQDGEELLLRNNWNEHNITSGVIELTSRWFANAMSPDCREQLVMDITMPITDALDSIPMLKAA